MTLPRLLPLLLIFALGARAADCNDVVLRKISEMPLGGRYGTSRLATIALSRATHFESGKFFVLPSPSSPSFCSGATYLVFLKAIEQLRRDGRVKLDPLTLQALMIRDAQPDGQGIWGRWNANGPGTARLFLELGLGHNSLDLASARPGDFMKIFWTPDVGATEHGHSVIFLGATPDSVRFWSSNVPGGFGEKTVPRSRIAHVILSRLEYPQNLALIRSIPDTDPYLSSLIHTRSSFAEACKMSGL